MTKSPDGSGASAASATADDASTGASAAPPQPVRSASIISEDAETGVGASIHAIDSVLRLEPGRTDRSSCYLEALARLSDGGRVCVERMESLMFAQNLRVRDCGHGELLLPNAVFECAQGQIWYHFSPKHRKFVLSFFHIDGRDGGLPIPVPVPSPGESRTPCNDDWADGIAARIASYLRHSRHIRTAALGLTTFPIKVPLSQTGWAFRDGEPMDSLLGDIVRTDCAMTHCDGTVALPGSSLLVDSVLVRQQLQNPFARAIVVGEVTCRLGAALDERVERFMMRWAPVLNRTADTSDGPAQPDRLLAESTAIIHAVANCHVTETLSRTVRHFLTASLMDSETMSDGLRLELIRSELIYRLSVSIAAGGGTGESRTSCTVEEPRAQAVLMRRYALLGEFVTLSSRLFDSGSKGPGGLDEHLFETTACGRRDRTVMKRLARCLLDFSASTALIVDHFSRPTDSSRNGGDRLDQIGMSNRLSSIAAEIFDAPVARLDALTD